MQTKYLAPFDVHSYTIKLFPISHNTRYYIQYQQCDVAASIATIFIWYARSTVDALINYKNTVAIPFLMYL